MRILKFNPWTMTSLLFFILTIFTAYQYFKEYQKNLPYKKELYFIEKSLERARKENLEYQKQVLSLKDPMSLEKEKKDKFGEAGEDEKVILVSEEILRNLTLPIFKK